MNESTLVPREEISDLDWLARNVHVWPAGDHQPWCYVYMVAGGAMKASGNFLDAVACPTMVTKDQWLARRAELQNKPSWKDAPDWAEWLHQDGYGEWEFSEGKPTPYDGLWLGEPCKRSLRAKVGEVLGDWRDTLEKRPEQAEFKPFVSVEDAQQELSELEMLAKASHLISKKRHRITTSKYTKTIHGASVDVYDVLQAWGVSNPALQHLIKKALQCGQRGHKDNAQDLQDIIDSAIRAKELES